VGPGATFWMILAGFLGMSTKMAECTLGVKYRNEHADGTVSGGPMYYLEKGVGAVTGKRALGKVLAVVFAIAAIGGSLGGGNMFQANQATAQIVAVTGGDDSPFARLELGHRARVRHPGRPRHHRRHPLHRPGDGEAGPVHGRALPDGVRDRARVQRRQDRRRLR
jgi:hypothetical protein